MRVTIDLPDAVHAELKQKAAAEDTTMRALILRGVDIDRQRGMASAAKATKRMTKAD